MKINTINLEVEDKEHECIEVNFQGSKVMLQLSFKGGRPLIRILGDYKRGSHVGINDVYLRVNEGRGKIYTDVTMTPEFNEDGFV